MRAVCFHLGALTRLNELGLLAGVETIRAVAGGGIVAALLATRVQWPLHGAYRDWPEEMAEPLREIARSKVRSRGLWGPLAAPGPEGDQEERFARELLEGAQRPERPMVVIGAAGLALGRMAASGRGDPDLRWELGGPEGRGGGRNGLTPLGGEEVATLENQGYLQADAALREQRKPPAALEPLPPIPPRPPRTGAGTPNELPDERRWQPLRRWRRPTGRGRAAAAGGEELLERHRPFVRYDSLESYRADSVAAILELAVGSRGNVLHRADGTPIACSLPGGGPVLLDLDYLGGSSYADGLAARRGDYLDEAGGSHAADALEMRRRPGCGDVVYGHALRAGGRLWLQYWLFHYYNDKGFLKAWRHEGDWEMVQLRIGEDGRPDAIVCSQQAAAERAGWEEVERRSAEDGEAPVIYCARGSHAPRLRAGTFAAPVVPDHNDGRGPLVRPRLERIGGEGPGWAQWPGRWGSTRRRESFEGDSPRGPSQHPQWREPEELHREARPASEAPPWRERPPVAPRLSAHREGDAAVLSYRFPDDPGGGAAPVRIVAGAYGGDPAAIVTHSFLVESRGGICVVPAPPGEEARGIRVSVCSELGTPGETIAVPIER